MVQGKDAKDGEVAKGKQEAKEDRRVQRTRQLLRDALVAEILSKGYEALTVQDILDRANLGRSTFYAHYHDKEELLLSGFADFRAAFETRHWSGHGAMAGALDEGDDFSLALFRHVAQFRAVGKAMFGKQSGNLVLNHLRRLLVDHLHAYLGRQAHASHKTTLPLDVIVEFAVSSLLGLLVLWLDHDLPYTPEQMDAMFKQLTLPGLSAALATKTE